MNPARRASLAALAGAALALAAAAEGARRIDPVPAPRMAAAHADLPALAPPPDAPGDSLILAAVERDPFRADRRRPPGRYRLPGSAPPPAAPFALPHAPPPLSLLGTVVLGDGRGLAALGAPGGESRVLRQGDTIAGFRLVRVESGAATLANGDTTLMLRTAGGDP